MRVEETKTEKIYISELENLDPITVFIEELGKEKGKITIECFGRCWTSYWGAMWKEHTVRQFFKKVDRDYAANCLESAGDNDETKYLQRIIDVVQKAL